MARQDENGEPIDMTAMPRPHRRRREKKLMTMDEVNDRFPLLKYKAWITSRAEQGLSTAGGVASPPSRAASIKAASVKNAEGILAPHHSRESEEAAEPVPTTSTIVEHDQPEKEDAINIAAQAEDHDDHKHHEHDTKTLSSTIHEHTHSHESTGQDEDMDDDDQIQTAVPAELLANPGDSCAICLDTLDDEDDVRGLTCGHAFHASCIDPWLTGRRACCPLCKADYYVPKPRPEGEATTPTPPEADRATRGRLVGVNGARIDQPAPTHFAFIGGRGGQPFRPRMILPGRFMTITYAEGHDRSGLPTVHRIPRLSRRQRQDNADVSYLTSSNNPRSSSNQPNSWRSRMRQTFTLPLPSTSLWRRNNGAGTGASDHPPEIRTSSNDPTPGQLEAGPR